MQVFGSGAVANFGDCDFAIAAERIDKLDAVAAIVDAGFNADAGERVDPRDHVANRCRHVSRRIEIDRAQYARGACDLQVRHIDAGTTVERRQQG
jgi:hypothetical protein